MKKLVLTLTLTALTTSAFAAEPLPMSEFCPKIAELARAVMEVRQNGAPMREVMELAENQSTVLMITSAYSQSVYNTPDIRERVIQDFEDHWYLQCIKSYDN